MNGSEVRWTGLLCATHGFKVLNFHNFAISRIVFYLYIDVTVVSADHLST